MASSVLDASALLAYIQGEAGAATVQARIAEGTLISAVNLAEVLSTIAQRGAVPADVMEELAATGNLGQSLRVREFAAADAIAAAELRPATRALGLSLADRVCVALAAELELPVLTADRAWAHAELPVRVEVIR